MRCVSKCFFGRSFKVYSLLFLGIVVGFALSTFIQLVVIARVQLDRPLQVFSQRDTRPLRVHIQDQVLQEDHGARLGFSDYDFPGRELGKHKSEADFNQEVVAGGNRKPNNPSSSNSLAVPNPVNRLGKEYGSRRLQGRSAQNTGGGEATPPAKLSDEYASRQTLLVGVITKVGNLMTQTLAIQGTWGSRATQVIYFVGEVDRLPHLPSQVEVVQLQGVDEEQTQWELKEFLTIKYLVDNCLDQADWFMLIDDQTYVAVWSLEEKLNQLDSRFSIYMGLEGDQYGEGEEGQKGGSLCQRDPGVVYSWGLLDDLRHVLPSYWPGSEGDNGELLHNCLRSLEVQCTSAMEVSNIII